LLPVQALAETTTTDAIGMKDDSAAILDAIWARNTTRHDGVA
jgi:hypothetical protein